MSFLTRSMNTRSPINGLDPDFDPEGLLAQLITLKGLVNGFQTSTVREYRRLSRHGERS